jgi:hypothetical protein
MKLHIQSLPNCSQEELRALLIDAADQLAGANSCLLEPKLHWDGNPILLADAQGHPVLLSFDTENSQAALLNGLHAIEQLAVALPWVNQVYDNLKQQQKAPRLVVVSREPPPGAGVVLADCSRLKLFTYRVLRINDDTGIWLECLEQEHGSAGLIDTRDTGPKAVNTDQIPAQPTPTGNMPTLSEDERADFRQL